MIKKYTKQKTIVVSTSKKYNIVHDTLKINFFTLTFPPKEEYYDASENSTKRATRWEVFNTLTISIYKLHKYK